MLINSRVEGANPRPQIRLDSGCQHVSAGGRYAENRDIFMSIVSYVVHVCYLLSIVTHTPAYYQNRLRQHRRQPSKSSTARRAAF